MSTKAELRKEIAELRSVGGQMSAVCFNLGQHYDADLPWDARRTVRNTDLQKMQELHIEWDAIKRAEWCR